MVTTWLELCISYHSSLSLSLSVIHHSSKIPEWRHSGIGLPGLSWKMAIKEISLSVVQTGFVPNTNWCLPPGCARRSWTQPVYNNALFSIRAEWSKARSCGHTGLTQWTSALFTVWWRWCLMIADDCRDDHIPWPCLLSFSSCHAEETSEFNVVKSLALISSGMPTKAALLQLYGRSFGWMPLWSPPMTYGCQRVLNLGSLGESPSP